MKTSELQREALNWAVAKCEGYFDIGMASVHDGVTSVFYFPLWQPSTDWALAGPIIEREISRIEDLGDTWEACGYGFTANGPTPLIAAMRCYVASKLGDEVEVPDELA
jgi:hypothetical protein